MAELTVIPTPCLSTCNLKHFLGFFLFFAFKINDGTQRTRITKKETRDLRNRKTKTPTPKLRLLLFRTSYIFETTGAPSNPRFGVSEFQICSCKFLTEENKKRNTSYGVSLFSLYPRNTECLNRVIFRPIYLS